MNVDECLTKVTHGSVSAYFEWGPLQISASRNMG